MDQVKIGKFISQCRKEKNLTQAQVADKLAITDRAVSKWENGRSLPDSSIMLELCEILGISVNELLSGERINMENYEQKVNENLVKMQKQYEAINKAARAGFILTIILLLIYNTVNVIKYGVEEAIDMPAFIIMTSVTAIWMIIYIFTMNKNK